MNTSQFTPTLVQTFKTVASLIKKSKNIVLMPHAKMDCDGMSASVALHLILQKFGKHSTTVCSDPVPESFAFLPSSNIFMQEMVNTDPKNQRFSLSVNDTENKFKNLEYSVEDGKINIILFSEDTPFTESDFTFLGSQLKPDLIITLDSGDTFQLGKMYEDNKELFNTVPVINIDHHESNTQFGSVNLVDHTSCSTTQLVYNLIHFLREEENIQKTILDKDISTLILAGMLTDTGSFQHSNTTPEALDIASILIDHGAEHQKIVKHLFKTKSLATLKIWGRVLTKLQNDPLYKIVWSSVSANDLEETHSHSDDTNDLIDELMATTPDTDLVLLVKEREDNIISTSVRSASDAVDSIAFTSIFGGGGHKQAAGFKIRDKGGKSFEEIVSDIVYEAKKFQAQRLNIPLPTRDLTELIEKPKNTMPDFPQESDFEEEEITGEQEQIEQPKQQEEIKTEEREKMRNKTEEPAQKKQKKIKYTKAERDAYNAKKREEFNNKQKEAQKKTQDLSEEEIPYAQHKEYFEMPTPEKYIEKQEEENYDDFADFLSKADDDDEVTYLTENETAKIHAPSQNPFPENNTPA